LPHGSRHFDHGRHPKKIFNEGLLGFKFGLSLLRFGFGAGLELRIPRNLAGGDRFGLGFLGVGSRFPGVGALLARGVGGDLGFVDRFPFGKLGLRFLFERGVFSDGLGFDPLLRREESGNDREVIEFDQDEDSEKKLHPSVSEERSGKVA